MQDKTVVYKRQLAIVAFIASFTFKIAMLPQYLTVTAGTGAWISVFMLMIVEMLMFALIYNIIKKQSILSLGISRPLKSILMVFIFFSSFIKFVVLGSETLNFLSINMLEGGEWQYLLLALMPIVGYIAYKGTNTLARTAQVSLLLIIPTLLFTVIFFNGRVDFGKILPLFADGTKPIFEGVSSHFLWFGDFTPLLFMTLSKKDKKKDASIATAIVSCFVGAIAFMFLFTALFGEAGEIAGNAFARIARFNRASSSLGGVDFPIIIMWIVLAIIKLSLLMYAMVEAGTFVFRRRGLAVMVSTLGIYFTLVYGVRNLAGSYSLATGWVGFAVASIEYALPVIYFVISEVKYAKAIAK